MLTIVSLPPEFLKANTHESPRGTLSGRRGTGTSRCRMPDFPALTVVGHVEMREEHPPDGLVTTAAMADVVLEEKDRRLIGSTPGSWL
jgi:hypothetical protein